MMLPALTLSYLQAARDKDIAAQKVTKTEQSQIGWFGH